MTIVKTKDKFQINYKNPQVVNGRGDPSGRPYIYAVREEQFAYEWFQREAGNWTLVSKSFAYKPTRAPTIKLIWMNWTPAGIRVEMSNYWDENNARLNVYYWWKANVAQTDWRLEIQIIGIKVWLAVTAFINWFAGDIIQTLIDMQTLLNVQTEAKDTYTFKWTPGEGDNTLSTIPSLERVLQEEQASRGVV